MATQHFQVLIVDDDPATRSGLSELLEAAGYETCAVGTFEEAQHRLRHSSPDLLITDIRLGAFNGLHLLIVAGNRLPVILMTGFDDPVLEADARRRGAEYVLKPLDPASFLRLVQRRVGEGHQEDPAMPSTPEDETTWTNPRP